MARSLSLRVSVRLLILALCLCFPLAATAQQVHIQSADQGGVVTVRASAEMKVDPRAVWSVITDYDHLADFIPDISSSRVTHRDGKQLRVAQTGEFGLLFFRQHIEVTLAVEESPMTRVVARGIAGNLREMQGRYELKMLAPGTVQLLYEGRVLPDFAIPPIFGMLVMRQLLSNQFSALVKEIMRRDALARGALPPR
jgi:carbon monoxide dehydrogenase subunit G